MEGLFTADALVGLLTLTALEIVLGVDNIIFITILAGKLPAEQQSRARTTGLALAFITRVLLLLSLSWIIGLVEPLFELPLGFLEEEARGISGRDIILLVGGLFLLGKATYEIHERLEGHASQGAATGTASFAAVIVQILLLDIVFSLDSVITAVGMVDNIWIMIGAVLIAIIVMLVSARAIADFVNRHPTVKMLALSFLLLIGMTLVAEGFEQHIPKGYVYFAMAFSVFVELLNLRIRGKGAQPIDMHQPYNMSDQAVREAIHPQAIDASRQRRKTA